MILSAGLTPAWQQILVFDTFHQGQVNRAREVVWCASGKVLNAGIAAHHLGGPSLTLAMLGGLPLRAIEAEFAALGVPRRWVQTAAATRVCTTILDRGTGTMTELVENGRPVTAEEREAFCQAYREQAARADVVVLIGSLPSGTPVSLYRELLESTACPVVLDFRGEGLLSVLDLAPYVVKPNRDELAQTVGGSLDRDEDLIAAMQMLNRRGAQWVVVTHGAGPVWVSSSRDVYRLVPPALDQVVNPIASGDALAATIAWATRAGRPLPEAVRLGMAAAAQNVQQLLPCRLQPERLQDQAAKIALQVLC
jgi:1-phosphofructokinase family hexose kinase